MTRYLTIEEVLELHRMILQQSGGASGIRDMASVDSALAQPRMTFDGRELLPTLAEKAAALGFSLISNHPFVDGNKRVGHACLETFLVLNGWELFTESVDEQEAVILQVAQGRLTRQEFASWVQSRVRPICPEGLNSDLSVP